MTEGLAGSAVGARSGLTLRAALPGAFLLALLGLELLMWSKPWPDDLDDHALLPGSRFFYLGWSIAVLVAVVAWFAGPGPVPVGWRTRMTSGAALAWFGLLWAAAGMYNHDLDESVLVVVALVLNPFAAGSAALVGLWQWALLRPGGHPVLRVLGTLLVTVPVSTLTVLAYLLLSGVIPEAVQ
ncbi:hypothetical protein V5P93_006567 [Actinokineospora auranticolor]|uniref:Uncharacterized protein n=1 Tax=Actinokineospora auranticolor TaxID=155976 RepID=A0A2S6GX23_9PSEU|nr:hypothetical protein [Actinokineospora auranticolor]PPK69792.1 hypothetical protein CLV40_103402 [Actinokineospora auranticolor]